MEKKHVLEARKLEEAEIRAVLARNFVGRLAYARGNHADIEPIHYVYSDGWIYGRTSRGRKLEKTGETWWPVAFEVDEIESLYRWRSVVVSGGFYVLSPEGPDWEREERERGVQLLRSLVPETFTDADPFPYRDVVFRIAVQEATGRAMEGPA
jgi:uncharacterized protein